MEVASVWVLLLCLCLPTTSAFQWTSAANFPDGKIVPSCVGENVFLPWNYDLSPAEHVITVEWYYRAPGGQDRLMAVESSGNFLHVPGLTQDVRRYQGAGLQIRNLTANQGGEYSVRVHYDMHGSSHTQTQSARVQAPETAVVDSRGLRAIYHHHAVYDPVTRDWHAQLTCEGLLSLGQPPVSIVWKTPSGAILPSSSQQNGTFTLNIPNPPQDGAYTCLPSNQSSLHGCGALPLHTSATTHVSSYDARFATMEARMRELQTQNADLIHTVQTLTSSPVTAQPIDAGCCSRVLQEVQDLTNQNRDLHARLDSALQISTQQGHQLQNLTNELARIRSREAITSAEVQLLKYMDGAPLRVGDRVVRGRDWGWGNQDGSPPGPGTVVAVPTDKDHIGWVTVHWDSGRTDHYRMGDQGLYDLRLV